MVPGIQSWSLENKEHLAASLDMRTAGLFDVREEIKGFVYVKVWLTCIYNAAI